MTKFSTVINYGDAVSGQFIETLPFIPDTVIVDNQSPYTVYGRIGGSDIPTSLANADVSVLPLTYKTFPVNSGEVAFGFGLPTVAPKQPGYQNSAQLTFTAGEPSAFQAPLVPPQSLQTLDVIVDTLSELTGGVTNRQVSLPDGTRSILIVPNGDFTVLSYNIVASPTNRSAYLGTYTIEGNEYFVPYFNVLPNENVLSVTITYPGSGTWGYTVYAMSDWVVGRPWNGLGIPFVNPIHTELPVGMPAITNTVALTAATIVTWGTWTNTTREHQHLRQLYLRAAAFSTQDDTNVFVELENSSGTIIARIAQISNNTTAANRFNMGGLNVDIPVGYKLQFRALSNAGQGVGFVQAAGVITQSDTLP